MSGRDPIRAGRVDAHQHFWQLAARAGAWPPPELAPIHRDFLPDDLAALLHQNGVAATVLVQSMPDEADTRFMLDLADRHAFIAAVVGWVDLKAPDAPAVEAMLRHGLRFDALVLPRHLPSLLAFARRHPELPIVIDHLAKPAMGAVPDPQWLTDMARLAARPRVECKLSGMVTEVGPGWTVERLAPYARHVLQVFGPERVMWGSDWPVLRLAADYAAWMDASEALLAHLAPAQREAVFGSNARRFYGIAP